MVKQNIFHGKGNIAAGITTNFYVHKQVAVGNDTAFTAKKKNARHHGKVVAAPDEGKINSLIIIDIYRKNARTSDEFLYISIYQYVKPSSGIAGRVEKMPIEALEKDLLPRYLTRTELYPLINV